MPNSKYTQVVDLLAAGKLRWDSDLIEACLLTGASFDAGDKTLSEVGQSIQTTTIQGRWVAPGGNFIGQPALFQNADGDSDYQVVLVQNTGMGDPNLLAWYDTDEGGGSIHLDNAGTLIIRPSLLENPPEGAPDASRLWMKV